MIKNFGSYHVDCPGGVRQNIFAKDTKHLSTLFMKRKHERNKHFQFSTRLYLQVLATRESNNNFRTNLVDRKESFGCIHQRGQLRKCKSKQILNKFICLTLTYREVPSTILSLFEAHAGYFRWSMKGKSDVYLL